MPPPDRMLNTLRRAVDAVRATPGRSGHLVRLRGCTEVLVAGDPEWRIEAERLRDGIPIAQGNWDNLIKAAQSVGVAAPVQ